MLLTAICLSVIEPPKPSQPSQGSVYAAPEQVPEAPQSVPGTDGKGEESPDVVRLGTDGTLPGPSREIGDVCSREPAEPGAEDPFDSFPGVEVDDYPTLTGKAD